MLIEHNFLLQIMLTGHNIYFMDIDEVVGLNIRSLLVKRRIDQEDLANATGIKYNALLNRLAGRVGWKVSELKTIAQYLDVEISELLDDSDYKHSPETADHLVKNS